jgi:hypothetical protein
MPEVEAQYRVSVRPERDEMIARITITPYSPGTSMPQDRKLLPAVEDDLSDLLKKVHK